VASTFQTNAADRKQEFALLHYALRITHLRSQTALADHANVEYYVDFHLSRGFKIFRKIILIDFHILFVKPDQQVRYAYRVYCGGGGLALVEIFLAVPHRWTPLRKTRICFTSLRITHYALAVADRIRIGKAN